MAQMFREKLPRTFSLPQKDHLKEVQRGPPAGGGKYFYPLLKYTAPQHIFFAHLCKTPRRGENRNLFTDTKGAQPSWNTGEERPFATLGVPPRNHKRGFGVTPN